MQEILVKGNRFIEDGAILVHLGELQDRPVTASLLHMGFQRLWDTGLFEDIEIRREDMEEGGCRLVVWVVEKPMLRDVRIEGDHPTAPSRDVLAQLGERGFDLRPRRPLSEREAQEAAQELENHLGPDYEVSSRLEPVGDGRADLVLSVERRPLPRIESLTFSGNHALGDEELRGVMRLEQSDWTTWLTRRDRLRPAMLEDDLARIRALYESRGFIDVEVGPPQVAQEGSRRVQVTIPIQEGPRYLLRSLSIEPGFLLEGEDVRAGFLREGDPYDRVRTRRFAESIARRYQNEGYAGVDVDLQEEKVFGTNDVNVALVAHPGLLYYVEKIEFQGNTWSRDTNLREVVGIAEGAPFRLAAVEAGAERLMALGAFELVRHEVRLLGGENRVDLIYHITERPRFDYLVGGSVTGMEGVSGAGTFMARDIVGQGETWNFEGDLGNRLANFAIGFGDPFSLRHRLVWSAGFAGRDLTYPDETREKADSLALTLSGPEGSRWQFQSRYRWARYELTTESGEPVPFLTPFEGQPFDASRMALAAAYEGRDRLVLPTRGTAAVFGTEFTGGVLGGDLSLIRARVRATQLVSLDDARRHLVELRGETESVWPYAETEVEGLPRSERLFLGGEQDMRGFDIRAVGPRLDDVVVGGDSLVYGSVEYQYGFHPSARLIGFFDLGNVYSRELAEEPSRPALRYDTGAEIRFVLPFLSAPFRIGYGFNLNPRPDESHGRFFIALAARF